MVCLGSCSKTVSCDSVPLSSHPFFPAVDTSAPGEATRDLGVPAGSVNHPFPSPTTEDLQHRARMEQYLLICKLPPFQTAGKEKTTSRRQSQLGKERRKQASKAQWDDPCLQIWAKHIPGMHMACFQWLWEPQACFPVSWKWVTCSPLVLIATGQPPHTLLSEMMQALRNGKDRCYHKKS